MRSLSFAVCVFLGACASVTVTKVSDPNGPHGFRYYLPRPYVAVKKPFLVAGSDTFVFGTVKNGNVVELAPGALPKGLLSSDELGGATIPLSIVHWTDKGALQQQSTAPDAGSAAGTSADAGSKESPAKDKETESSTNASGVATAGDPTTSPKLDVNDFFDLVYLPDFSEQYAIEVSGGVGIAELSVGLENGWMLEKSSAKLDNSGLAKFLTSSAEKFVDLGLDIATALASPLVPASLFEQQAKPSAPEVKVLLRVRTAVEAQPGLYPLLKPGEADGGSSGFDAQSSLWLPRPPFTQVAYSVRRTVAVELVSVIGGAREPAKADGVTESNPVSEEQLRAVKAWVQKLAPDLVVQGAVRSAATITCTVKEASQKKLADANAAAVAKLAKERLTGVLSGVTAVVLSQ